MEEHHNLSDKAFEKQFTKGLLPPSYFSHEAHLRLAWIHVSNYGVETAVKNITTQIEAFTKKHGAHDKYNATVTVAAVRAVHHFINKSKSDSFKEFIEEFPRLKLKFKELLGHHYAIDIFASEEAKEEYIEPDLSPFDED